MAKGSRRCSTPRALSVPGPTVQVRTYPLGGQRRGEQGRASGSVRLHEQRLFGRLRLGPRCGRAPHLGRLECPLEARCQRPIAREPRGPGGRQLREALQVEAVRGQHHSLDGVWVGDASDQYCERLQVGTGVIHHRLLSTVQLDRCALHVAQTGRRDGDGRPLDGDPAGGDPDRRRADAELDRPVPLDGHAFAAQ